MENNPLKSGQIFLLCKLNLHFVANKLIFSVTAFYLDECECQAMKYVHYVNVDHFKNPLNFVSFILQRASDYGY